MKVWTWPSVVVLGVLVAAVVIMFALTDDAEMRKHLVDYFDAIVPFVIGAAAGAGVGGPLGFSSGFTKGFSEGRTNVRSAGG